MNPDHVVQDFLFEGLPRLMDEIGDRSDQSFSEAQFLAIKSYLERVKTVATAGYFAARAEGSHKLLHKRIQNVLTLFTQLQNTSCSRALDESERDKVRDALYDAASELSSTWLVLEEKTPEGNDAAKVPGEAIDTAINALGGLGLSHLDGYVELHGKQNVLVQNRIGGRGNGDNANKLIVLVHGIRTRAPWYQEVSAALVARGFQVSCTNYGKFDLLRFLMPINVIKQMAVRNVFSQIRRARIAYPDTQVSIIAHSFGTFIVTEILRTEFDFDVDRVIFCGSVVSEKFPWQLLRGRYRHPVLNEIGDNDPYPILADSITLGYGPTGSYGYRVPEVEDRWHSNHAHSDFLTKEFCDRFWIPFLEGGAITPGSEAPKRRRWYISLIGFLKVRSMVFVALTVYLALILLKYFDSGKFFKF